MFALQTLAAPRSQVTFFDRLAPAPLPKAANGLAALLPPPGRSAIGRRLTSSVAILCGERPALVPVWRSAGRLARRPWQKRT